MGDRTTKRTQGSLGAQECYLDIYVSISIEMFFSCLSFHFKGKFFFPDALKQTNKTTF